MTTPRARPARIARPGAAGLLALLVLLLGGCAATPMTDALVAAPPPGLRQGVELEAVPFFPQERYQCGPAALATVLAATGVDVRPERLVPQVFIPARQGTLAAEMIAATRRHGRIPYPLAPALEDLVREVHGGRPVLVFQNLGLDWLPRWHFAVVVGHDPTAAQLILRSGTTRRHRVDMALFERTWRRGGHWAVVALRPGELAETARPEAYFRAVAAYERTGDLKGARRAYDSGRRRWPDHPALAMGYAGVRYQEGDPDEAMAVLADLVAAHPDYAPAHNNLATLLLEAGRPGPAEAHARRAVSLGGPHASTYRRTLAEVRDRRRQ